jgi:hypothetical protein
MAEDYDWTSNGGSGFGASTPADELYHGTGGPGDTLTETWFWNFYVAEANINCFAYCWVHPNLKVVSSGLFIYQGFKPNHLACELFEMRDFNSIAVIGDGSDINIPSGFRVRSLDPLKHSHMTFDDPARLTKVDVHLRAIDVPIMRANNKHFEQVMHATGTLLLRGKEYKVDSYPVRDRSWGEARPENHAPLPPYTWVTGAFGKDFAFNLGAHDDPASEPEWLGKMPVPAAIFRDGWVVVNGEQRRIVSATKTTKREMPWCRPLSHSIKFTDTAGDTYEMEGKVLAQTDWSGWSNTITHLGLVEWTWDGRTGHGETQEVQWNDYVYLMNK